MAVEKKPARNPLTYQASRLRRDEMVSFGKQSPKHRAALEAELARRLDKIRAGFEDLLRLIDAA